MGAGDRTATEHGALVLPEEWGTPRKEEMLFRNCSVRALTTLLGHRNMTVMPGGICQVQAYQLKK